MLPHWRLLGCALIVLLLACQAGASSPSPGAGAESSAAVPASNAASASEVAPLPALQKITVAILSTNELQVIPWIAKDSGAFARHGLDPEVVVVAGSPRVTQSL